MRINSKLVVRAVTWLATLVLRAWMGSVRTRFAFADPVADPRRHEQKFIFVYWHETILLEVFLFRGQDVYVLISQSHDGEYIAQIAKHLRFIPVRGSSTRGALRAVRELTRSAADGHVAITPDGPRGPRRQLQSGSIYLASRTGLPVVASGLAFDRPWRARSWDRFVVPRPFSRAACYFGPPLFVPPDLDAAQLAEYQQLAQADLDFATEQAERLLKGEPLMDPPSHQSCPAAVSARN